MTLDDSTLLATLRSIHAHPTVVEASAIFDLARLAAAADKRSDVGETTALLALSRAISEMAGTTALMSATGIDASRLFQIGEVLVPAGARELAYACAFLVMISDLELSQEEGELAGKLAEALVLDRERAQQLAAQMEALVRQSS